MNVFHIFNHFVTDYAWVWARSKKLEGKSKKEFHKIMKSHPFIDTKKLEWEHFSENYCTIKENTF